MLLINSEEPLMQALSSTLPSNVVLPSRDFAQAARLFRFGFAILGAFAGLFGVTVGFIAMLIHLAGLTSLDVPYLMPFSGGSAGTLLRHRAGREGQ